MIWGPEGTFKGRFDDRDFAIEVFNEHNEAVKATVPPERLLVHEIRQGWEPLCDFLGVPVPADPLPHANDRATFLDRVIGGAIATLDAWRSQAA